VCVLCVGVYNLIKEKGCETFTLGGLLLLCSVCHDKREHKFTMTLCVSLVTRQYLSSFFFPPSIQTNEDTNLGKPWFHDSVGREEAVELLTQSESWQGREGRERGERVGDKG